MAPAEMPIFTRTFDFLSWLLPATNHFPRAHRHTLTQRLLDAAFDLRERIEEANVQQSHRASLVLARNQGDLLCAALSASILGWVNQARYGNTVGLRKSMLRRAVFTRPTSTRHHP